jgi:N-acyl-L-homoserine lactone synthetase
VASSPAALDALVAEILERQRYRFTIATDEAGRETTYRLRHRVIVDQGWAAAGAAVDAQERDGYDDTAVHVLGWDGDTPIAAGRLVVPPHPLPTEDLCRITVEPRGRVVDVGRLLVARSHQDHGHSVFVALLARLYLEMRARGFEVACGVMSARVRSLVRLLGLRLDVLGDDRPHLGELRAPVRFTARGNASPLSARWE